MRRLSVATPARSFALALYPLLRLPTTCSFFPLLDRLSNLTLPGSLSLYLITSPLSLITSMFCWRQSKSFPIGTELGVLKWRKAGAKQVGA